jgi:HD-GYP domain-containing protein (c-di-GMP phosphodiesterase class II)
MVARNLRAEMTATDRLAGRRHAGNGVPGSLADQLSTVADATSIRLLVETMRLRDRTLADHCLRSAHMAAAIADGLGAGTELVRRAYLAGLLHDVGKLGVAEAILWKPAGLDTTEWQEMRTHPERGHRLVAGLVHEDVAAAVLYHHERVDGAGYPFRVPLRTLPATVRIVQVADAYDALTSDRPYEPPVPPEAAMAEISRCSGTQFDPDVVEALRAVFDGEPTVMTTGEPLPIPAVGADPFE